MTDYHPGVAATATTDGLPIAPSLGVTLAAARMPRQTTLVTGRTVALSLVAIGVAVAATISARLLMALIALVTNLAYFGRWSLAVRSPAGHAPGAWAVAIPVLGGIVVGLMARFGSRAIRGHGIPEAMEQVLLNESRIAPRLTFLKPVSSAIAIGTGGPFGAEGPIIATGGALGSVVGQLLRTTAVERKILLAAGAAAGMTAIFGSPVSAVILAVELLLFELRPRSIIPVSLACVTAAGLRYATLGMTPIFAMPDVAQPGGGALVFYVALGAVVGLLAVGVTRLVYLIEDAFERLPVNWMWWPALGGVVVGLVGLVAPRTLGVGYDNIEQIVNGQLVGQAVLVLCLMKLVSWAIALGSGTSGGTLAPLFTIGGGFGSALGAAAALLLPAAGIDPRIAALVGMAAIFAGASRALLASVVFAFETTLQPVGILPLLGGCTAAYLVSCLLMRHTIMTEKIARRGVRVPSEYSADFLEQLLVRNAASRPITVLNADEPLGRVRAWLASGSPEAHHQGFPVVDPRHVLCGVVTRRDLQRPDVADSEPVRVLIRRPPVIVFEDNSLREAADHMVREDVGRLPVVSRSAPGTVVGIITRGDLLAAHARRLRETYDARRSLLVGTPAGAAPRRAAR